MPAQATKSPLVHELIVLSGNKVRFAKLDSFIIIKHMGRMSMRKHAQKTGTPK